MKRIILLILALLLISTGVYLYPYVVTFIKTECGPLHVTDPLGMVCPCEYGDLKVQVTPDAQAHVQLQLSNGKGETVYMQVTEEKNANAPVRGLFVCPYVLDAPGRITAKINDEGYAVFSIKIPQHLFDAAEGYSIYSYGNSSNWRQDQRREIKPH